ncbi:MAG: thioredoxin family protein, partial [Lysobacterales bacterium]
VLYISQTRDAVFGGLALFLLALGMGAPLLVFGATAGRLMPRAGTWMDAVKAGFGVVFLLLAVWMLERILPPPVTLFLLGAVMIGAGVALRALDSLPATSSGLLRVWKSVGVLLLLIGSAQVIGALSGARDWMHPLANVGGGGANPTQAHVEFRTLKSTADFERELEAATKADRPLLLDFYADWCVSCKEMDKYTFNDAAVIAAAEDFVRVKADVTANDDTDKALLKRFGLIGPPSTLLFDRAGVERRDLRLLGYEKALPFEARLRQVQATGP